MFEKLLGTIEFSKCKHYKILKFYCIDKATSPLLLEPDWETILRLCDVIKSVEVT
jgi:hypothetical protein